MQAKPGRAEVYRYCYQLNLLNTPSANRRAVNYRANQFYDFDGDRAQPDLPRLNDGRNYRCDHYPGYVNQRQNFGYAKNRLMHDLAYVSATIPMYATQ